MKKFILMFLAVACGLYMFYILNIQKSYVENHVLLSILMVIAFILILVFLKITINEKK